MKPENTSLLNSGGTSIAHTNPPKPKRWRHFRCSSYIWMQQLHPNTTEPPTHLRQQQQAITVATNSSPSTITVVSKKQHQPLRNCSSSGELGQVSFEWATTTSSVCVCLDIRDSTRQAFDLYSVACYIETIASLHRVSQRYSGFKVLPKSSHH